MGQQFDRMEVFESRWNDFLNVECSHSTARNNSSDLGKYVRERPELRESLRQIVVAQLLSRRLDQVARRLRKDGYGFYTIASSGHEGNALIAAALRYGDPAYLHYRSGPFMAVKALQGADSMLEGAKRYILDTIRSFTASVDDPVSRGRHKVWGCAESFVVPQTSTIASHLPKAVGAALAVDRIRRRKKIRNISRNGRSITDKGRSDNVSDDLRHVPKHLGRDAVVVCSFGDASFNHSTAQGALNAASQTAHRGIRLPLLFVCEDNGIGISVSTPTDWISSAAGRFSAIQYVRVSGSDLIQGYLRILEAVEKIRETGKPVFLHLKTERLFGHAGSDFELGYRTIKEIEEVESRDPLLKVASLAVSSEVFLPRELQDIDRKILEEVKAVEMACSTYPKLGTSIEVRAALMGTGKSESNVSRNGFTSSIRANRIKLFDRLPEDESSRHMAVLINWCLRDLLIEYPESLIFGEDVGRKGGVYHVTDGLQSVFGVGRVFDTLLDEQSILGLAQGYAQLGYLPIPEIQYLAYVYNALDQIRGEACSMQYFSDGKFSNPMVIRIASFAYQKGFGGHFHNDNGFASLREIPGLLIAVPSRGEDAVDMLRTSMHVARQSGRVVAFMEPIARYMTKDLYEKGDRLWSDKYSSPIGAKIQKVGAGRIYIDHQVLEKNILIITYGNGTYMSLRAARTFRQGAAQVGVIVYDLRWLTEYDQTALMEVVNQAQGILIVDEGRRTGGVWESLAAQIAIEAENKCLVDVVVGEDVYIPLGPAANLVLPTEDKIVASLTALEKRIL